MVPSAFSTGGAFVLVMDDEETIRDLAVEMLRTLGCEVKACSCGDELVDLYQAHGFVDYLVKPYRMEELSAVLNRIL